MARSERIRPMQTNVNRIQGTLTAKCWKHNIAMYQKSTRVAGVDTPVQVWTCPACMSDAVANATATLETDARSN
jgi:hypothetical protein